MELNLWNSNQLLQQWLEKHAKNILKCDFDFDVANPSKNYFIEAISKRLSVTKEYLAIGAGISELISSLFTVPLWKNVFIFNPEFGLYSRCINNSMYRNYVTIINNDNIHKVVEHIYEYSTNRDDLLCISSPNWYTGEKMKKEEIEMLLDKFNGVIVLDEAYVDYSELPEELIPLAENEERLILLRSFSKGWFASGLRVGFMISKGYSSFFREKIISPHSVSTPSMRIINCVLSDPYLMRCFEATRKDIVTTREYLKKELDSVLYCKYYQSQSNFLTVLFDPCYLNKRNGIEHEFGVKRMDIDTIKEISLKYWISDMKHATHFINSLKER